MEFKMAPHKVHMPRLSQAPARPGAIRAWLSDSAALIALIILGLSLVFLLTHFPALAG
jgi:hypothetical protein